MNTGKPIGFFLGSPYFRLSKHVWLLALLLGTQTTFAQLAISWDNRFGTTNYEEIKGIVETADGNYLLGAHSGATPGFDFTGPTQGSNDYWVIKIDPAGNIIWDASFGGDAPENVSGIKALSDGNYIIYGWSSSGISGDKMTDPSGNAWWTNDFWVVKFDPTGTLIWEQSYGGTDLDQLWDVEETSDGGLIMGGMSTSGISGNKSEGVIGSWDMWVIKTDPLGNIQFDRTIGGSSADMCFTVAQAADGGYYAAGLSSSPPSGTKSAPHLGSNDYYLVKLDASGAVQWDRTFGGTTDDQLRDLKIAADGNLLLGGWSDSAPGGTKTAPHYGDRDFYLVKTTPNGAQIWDNSFGGSNRETGWYLTENSKGTYIMSGHSNSFPSGNKTSSTNGGNDYWWVYVDEFGNKLYENSVGGTLSDHTAFIYPTTDHGLLVAGASISNASGDKTVDNYDPSASPFTTDIWALKLDCNYIIPTVNDTILCQGQSMNVDMTTPYTCSYLWDDGSTSAIRNIGPSSTTSYSVTLTDINGCEEIEDFNVLITPNPTVDLGNDINACPPFLIGLNAGNPGHTFLWSTNETTQIITTNNPGTYSVTVTNSFGCSTVDNITINSLPVPVLSLGPDVFICEGESTILDAGNPGSTYIWSTSENTQTISVNSSDQYAIQVTNSDNCSVLDTIEVTVFPNPTFDLGNDTSFCLGESIILDAQNAGASYNWSTAESTQTIVVSTAGTYSATVTDGNSCQAFDTINIDIDLPASTLIDTSICSGDGFFVQGQMQFVGGTYYDTLITSQGCDSIITTTLSLIPLDTVNIVSYSCDPIDVGVFENTTIGSDGCDSLTIETVHFNTSDIVFLNDYDCDLANVGLDSVMLTNQDGCDSLVITETFLLPADTSYHVDYDCDLANVGMDSILSTNQNGCDSLIITETFLLPADTSYHVDYDCDIANVGIDSMLFNNSNGCDSLVITETILLPSDTTYMTEYSCLVSEVGIDTFIESGTFCDSTIIIETLFHPSDSTTVQLTSCNPNDLGTEITILSNQFGCDSTVTVITSFEENDVTELIEYTCDPVEAGIDSLLLVGQECDSLVITTTILNPSHLIQIDSFTCDSTAIGTDTSLFANQYGCDSTVVLNIQLISCTDVQEFSCDPLDVGIDTLYLTDNQGLDSLVYITTNLLNSDTTYLESPTCDPNQIGVFSDLLQNSNGCDSLVIDSVYLLPQSLTMFSESTCDFSLHGMMDTIIHVANNGCDSLVITETVYAALDTQYVFQNTCLLSTPAFDTVTTTNAMGCDSSTVISYQFAYADTIQIQNWTCDSTMTSVTESVINGLCDTLLINTVSYYDCTPTIIFSNTCDADSIGTYMDTLVNIVGLDSVIITNVSYSPADSLYTYSSSCHPSDTGMTVTTFINLAGCESYEFNYTSLLTSNFESIVDYSCDENDWMDSTIVFTNQYGCDSTIHLQVLPAFPEVEYLDYETCDPTQVRTDTVATLTSQYGCDSTVIERISLTNLNFDIDFEDILCDGDKGSIFINPIEGQSPFTYGLNDASLMQENPVFTDLESGHYQIFVEDDRGCIGHQEITFFPSSQISVELGNDLEIDLGEIVQLEAIVNQPAQSLSWLIPNDLSCSDCLEPTTQPTATITHFITVTDENGCESTDRITIFVKKDKAVYAPNAFSPNGDGENDIFTIYTNNSVEHVELLISDRFGEIVFQEKDLIPGDMSMGWNGTFNGRKFNPGVFVYMAKVKFIDGREEILKGDITLVR